MKKKQWNMQTMSKDEFDIIVRVMGLLRRGKISTMTPNCEVRNILLSEKQKRNEKKTLFEKYLRSGYEDFCDFKTYKYYVEFVEEKMKINRKGERK